MVSSFNTLLSSRRLFTDTAEAGGPPSLAFPLSHHTVGAPSFAAFAKGGIPHRPPHLFYFRNHRDFVSTVKTSVRARIQPCRKSAERNFPCAAGPRAAQRRAKNLLILTVQCNFAFYGPDDCATAVPCFGFNSGSAYEPAWTLTRHPSCFKWSRPPRTGSIRTNARTSG
jgi:hypothetical protein